MADSMIASEIVQILWPGSINPVPTEEEKDTSASILRAVAYWLEKVWAAQGAPPTPQSPFEIGMQLAEKIHREGTLSILNHEADRIDGGDSDD